MNFVNRHIRHVAADIRGEIAPQTFGPSREADRKWPIRYESIQWLAVGGDLATILLAGIFSVLLYQVHGSWTAADIQKAVGSGIVVSAIFVCLLKIGGKYRPTELLVLRSQLRAVYITWTSVGLLLAVAARALNITRELPQGAVLIFAVLGAAMLMAHRVILRNLVAKGLSGRRFAGRKVVLISDQPYSHHAGLAPTLSMLGVCVTERFSLPERSTGSSQRKRLSARVIEHTRGTDIEEVILEADPNRWAELRAVVAELRVLPLPVVFVPAGAASDIFRRPTRDLGTSVCVELQRGPLTLLERAAKRLVDLLGAGLALVMLAPLLALVAVLIKLDSPGPVLFRQKRCGFNGRSFAICKFRSMRVLEDGPSIIQAGPADSRVTRLGKWLRRTSIDELPQLFNVLAGSMSLVGPRPHAVAHDNQFDKLIRKYAFRQRVKPGLTGWAQIHGCRGPTPNTELIERRVEYDLWYIDNWSLRLDLLILIRTPFEVLRGRNAY